MLFGGMFVWVWSFMNVIMWKILNLRWFWLGIFEILNFSINISPKLLENSSNKNFRALIQNFGIFEGLYHNYSLS